MDWSKVQKEHVDAAIQKFIDEKPEHPEPRSYYLLYNGEKLPSKYIRGLAYSIATGEPINLAGFNGGVETVNFFKKYGYTVESVNVEGQKRKYAVNDAVWIATALLAYKNYITLPNAGRNDMYFKQAVIVHKAQEIAEKNVDAARVSWWVNADNKKSTQNYLRADSKDDASVRRLSKMDEFDEKAYPLGLDMTDILVVDDKEITLGNLYNFVKDDYPALLEENQMSNIDYLGILDYLKNNRELPYADPEKPGLTEEQKKQYLTIKKNGQNIVAELKKIYELCREKYGLTKCEKVSWDDGSHQKTRKYLWVPMKYGEYADSHVSISVFAEMITSDKPVFRISLELRNDKAKVDDVKRYHKHLELPVNVEAGLVYVSGSNELGRPDMLSESQEIIKQKVENKEYDKVQICKYISADEYPTNDEIEAGICEAVEALLPYYEYVVGETSGKRAWLLTWNPDNWNWENYDEACISTKDGETVVVPWTCSSKQPIVGDEIFLIKTGKQPRGIIAHGRVAKAPYEAPHYDPEKAAAGVVSGHIDAEYDWIQNYENEVLLLQDDLKVKFPEQQWSPMGSGIEIRNEYISDIRKMWKELVNKPDNEYWPSLEEYNPGITSEQWTDFILKDSEKYPSTLEMLIAMFDNGGKATCKHLSKVLGVETAACISRGSNFGRRSARFFNIEEYKDQDGKDKPFVTCFVGRYVEGNLYEWKLRDELKEALEMLMEQGKIKEQIKKFKKSLNVSRYDKNMILYGPPGTGKTYNTAIYAVAICKGMDVETLKEMPYADVMVEYEKLKKAGRIAFTTFHQSYGYEEFIEGIKPIVDQTKKEVGYTIEPGVFKKFCDNARTIESNGMGTSVNAQAQIWKLTIKSGDMNPIKQECFDEGNARMGFDYDAPDARAFVEDVAPGDIILSFKTRRTIDGIAVVTGDIEELSLKDTYQLSRKVTWLAKDIDEDITDINAGKLLHRMTFAKVPNMQLNDVLEIAEKYSINGNVTEVVENVEPYVFIIDEINRGNISKIFGELITLIENTKRAGMPEATSAILPYSGEPFSVPSNVYILGTMNTADRSIALMDTALRRRFQFEEMLPDTKVLIKIGADKINKAGIELNVATMLETINERIEYLFDREHTIGHAFFTGLKDEPTVEKLASIFKKSVIPLLQEYFYEDYSKIMLVLGDNGKTNDSQKFIIAKEIKPNLIFRGDTSDIDIPDYAYEIQDKAFYDIMSYIEITG